MGIYDRDWYRGGGPRFSLGGASMISILIGINVACFLLQAVAESFFRWSPIPLFGMGPAAVLGKLWVWQIFTSMFLHGGPFHLLINMLILWMFGRYVEQRLGRRPFLRFYLGAGLLAGVAYVVVGQFTAPFVFAVGASGAVMGVVVYFTFLAPNARVLFFFFIPMRMVWATTIWIAFDLYYFVFAPPEGTGVAHTAHLGGALFGLLYWRYAHRIDRFFVNLELRAAGRAARREARRGEDLQAEVDRLLDKIRDHGLDSLTEKERRFLRDASDRFRGRE